MDGERRARGDKRAGMTPCDLPHPEATEGLRGREAMEEGPPEHGAQLVLRVMQDDCLAAVGEAEAGAARADAEVDVLADVRVLGIEAADGVEGSALGQQIRRCRPPLL